IDERTYLAFDNAPPARYGALHFFDERRDVRVQFNPAIQKFVVLVGRVSLQRRLRRFFQRFEVGLERLGAIALRGDPGVFGFQLNETVGAGRRRSCRTLATSLAWLRIRQARRLRTLVRRLAVHAWTMRLWRGIFLARRSGVAR